MTLVDRYIYTVGGTTGFVYNMDVHRFDLTTCTWELVEPKSQYTPEPRLVFNIESAFVAINIESALVANLRTFAIKKYWVFICICGLLECFSLSHIWCGHVSKKKADTFANSVEPSPEVIKVFFMLNLREFEIEIAHKH